MIYHNSKGPVMIHRTGCCRYRNLSLYLLLNKGLTIVQINRPVRNINNTQGIDNGKNLRMRLISFSLSVQLTRLIIISYIQHTFTLIETIKFLVYERRLSKKSQISVIGLLSMIFILLTEL